MGKIKDVKKMTRYSINLINDERCVFDCAVFTNKKEGLKWAHGRG